MTITLLVLPLHFGKFYLFFSYSFSVNIFKASLTWFAELKQSRLMRLLYNVSERRAAFVQLKSKFSEIARRRKQLVLCTLSIKFVQR